MPTTSTAPFPYKNAYTDRLNAERGHHSHYMEYRKSLPAIDATTDVTWLLLEHFMAGVNHVAQDKGWLAPFSTIARLEFFWDVEEEYRGVVMFDSQGRLIVHVLNALLGYGGSGPSLSEQIMTNLGVPLEMFDEIQRSVWDQRPYKVVVSRQKHDVIDDVDTAYPTLDVESNWEWWRTR